MKKSYPWWCVLCAVLFLLGVSETRAQDANTLFDEGRRALAGQAYSEAIERFEQIIKDFPTSPIIDAVYLNLGLAHFFSGSMDQSIVSLERASAATAPKEVREIATFYKAQAKLSFAANLPKDDPKHRVYLEDAVKHFTEHMEAFPDASTVEDAIYGRGIANYNLNKISETERDLLDLLKRFSSSPNIADYQLLLGSIYAQETFKSINDKKGRDLIESQAQKALSILEEIKEASPEYVMPSNEARLLAAELLLAIADDENLKPAERAIEIARSVLNKEAIQKQLEGAIETLRANFRQANLAGNVRLAETIQLRINRRRAQLEELSKSPDPMVRAWITIGQAYFRLGKLDEARIVMSHVSPHTSEDQGKTSEFIRILTYAIQGAVEEADGLFNDYLKKYPGDSQADSVSLQIGIKLMELKEYSAALQQFEKSLRDFPQGRNADNAKIKRAEVLVALGRQEEGIKALQDFISKGGESPLIYSARFLLATVYTQTKNFEEAIKIYQSLADDPKSGEQQPLAAYQFAATYYLANRWSEAIDAFDKFISSYPNHASTAQAYYFKMISEDKNNELDAARKTAETLAEKFPESNFAPAALDYVGRQLNAKARFDEMIETYTKLIELFPKSKEASMGHFMLARNLERQGQYNEAAEKYNSLAQDPENPYAPAALYAKVSMWLKAAMSLGAYSAITEEEKMQWKQALENSEASAIDLIKRFPSSAEVPQALDELIKMLKVKIDAGQITPEEANHYFKNLRNKFESPIAQARIYAAEAGHYFQQNQMEAAFETFKNLLKEYPDASLGAEDWSRYGSLLLANLQYDEALSVFSKIQKEFPRDPRALANAVYGLGASHLAQGEISKAIPYFEELKSKYPWSEKIMEAEFALAMAAEQAGSLDQAIDRYRTVIMSNISTPELKAKSMIASGKILERQNKLLPNPQTNDPNAESFYLQPDAFFRESTASSSAEGLYLAAQINLRQNNPTKAKEILQRLINTSGYSETPWQKKAQDTLSNIR